MNANTVLKNYGSLTPEERFRLILAAGGRGDDAERERLLSAGKRISLSMPDHSPFGHAFSELSHLTFIELIEEAAKYYEAFTWLRDEPEPESEDSIESDTDEKAEEPKAAEDQEPVEDPKDDRPDWERAFDLALAAGFMLRVKYEGWKLFCTRLSVGGGVEVTPLVCK